jgi:hypothetical protein
VLWEATGGAPLKHDAAEAVMHQRQNGRVLAALLLGLAVHSGCTGVPDSATPRGAAGSAATAATPRASGLGDGTRPAQYFGYVMSQQSSTLLVLDTSRNEVIKKVTHPDMVKPASGRFHPTKRRYYAPGR